jgi:hypothetical protein
MGLTSIERHGDLGITTYKVVYNFFRGVAPKVLDSATSQASVGSAVGQIVTSMGVQMSGSLGAGIRHLMRGEVDRVGAVKSVTSGLNSVGKSADRAVRLLHRTVTHNKHDEAQFKTLVSGEDEDFLIEEAELSGYLARFAVKAPERNGVSAVTDTDMEKESAKKGTFRQKHFELKGNTLFFRKNKLVSAGSLFAVSFKIPLANVLGAIYFVEREEIILNQQAEGCMTRLRLMATDVDEDEDNPSAQANPTLAQWLDALKTKGVPCFTWKRAGLAWGGGGGVQSAAGVLEIPNLETNSPPMHTHCTEGTQRPPPPRLQCPGAPLRATQGCSRK